jgi:hypothetical protein
MLIDGLNLIEGSQNSNIVITNVTLVQRDAMTAVDKGEVVYVTDGAAPGLYTYNGTSWVAVTPADVTWNTLTDKPTFATVATSGSYNDLSDKPASQDLSAYATTAALAGYVPTSQKGAANGVATLDSTGVIPSAQLPSYVDDILEFADQAAFPATGEAGKIYISQAVNLTYRWTGTVYVEVSSAGGSPVASGVGFTATGNISATNLQAAIVELDTEKAPLGVVPASSTTTTLVAADKGKYVPVAANIAIPAGATYATGDVVMLYNNSDADKSITYSGITVYMAGTANTKTSPITFKSRGLATLLCTAANTYVITGDLA